MIENLEILETEQIPGRVHTLADEGYRFITMTCCSNDDGSSDLFYSFDRDYELVSLKTTVAQGTTVISISNIFLASSFVENEIAELFDVKFSGLAINYGGRFILSQDAPESPFGKGVIIVNKDGGSNE